MAETRRGGTYIMNNVSFGAMMLSDQVRPALVIVTNLIRARAKANSEASAAGGVEDRSTSEDQYGTSLADSYEVQRGPLVTLVVGGKPSPRISMRVVNRKRYAARREFGAGGHAAGRGTRDLRRAGAAFGDLAGEPR